MELTKQVLIDRHANGGISREYDCVLAEYSLAVYVNGTLLVRLICIHDRLESLVYGHLYGEGIINSASDISEFKISPEDSIAHVRLNIPTAVRTAKKLMRSAWNPETVMKNALALIEPTELFIATGNVHCVMLCREEERLCSAEDIGRYNALDKCIGHALQHGIDLSDTCVYTSGRIPSTIAERVINAGIPMIVSRAAPTDKTIEIARKSGLTVIGFARPGNMNVY